MTDNYEKKNLTNVLVFCLTKLKIKFYKAKAQHVMATLVSQG